MLGAGNIAEGHAPALRALPHLVEMVAVCDINLERARALQQRFGIPAVYDRLETMLREVKPDAVQVLLPAELHAAAAEECLEAGAHVFMEKPFCITVDECRRVEAVAKGNGLQIGVNHNVVWTPAFLDLLAAIRAGRFGALEQVQVMYTVPMPFIDSGVPNLWMFGAPDRLLLEIGPHPLSTCIRLLGRALKASAVVSGEVTLSNGARFFKHWQTSLVCERGNAQCTFSVGSGYLAAAIHVLGEDAQAFVDLRRDSIQVIEKTPYLRMDDMINGFRNSYAMARKSLSHVKAYSLGALGFAPRYEQQNRSFLASNAAFYGALAQGRQPRVNGAEGTAVVEACQMTIDSALAAAEQREEQVVTV